MDTRVICAGRPSIARSHGRPLQTSFFCIVSPISRARLRHGFARLKVLGSAVTGVGPGNDQAALSGKTVSSPDPMPSGMLLCIVAQASAYRPCIHFRFGEGS
ncbi:hypothetical protein BD626DRAFT_170903 [Schizophyllum amplum]|uniref:Uncharacterized protein n=1 Tax=Schizophyllum amplum TaxID=97359 RepID=A0A550CR20_9AGAR|nr:hypothetical protein BD626DRAFT_170903 [Auriculariopsis ampla]